MTEPVGGNKVG